MRNFAKMNLTGSENDAEFHEKQNEIGDSFARNKKNFQQNSKV